MRGIENIPDQGRSTVLNLRREPALRQKLEHAPVHDGTVLIDRRTKWGNPFRIGRDGTREQVIALYRADLWRRIRLGTITLEDLAELHGMRLACWCDPLPCHGHVTARAAAWAASALAGRKGP